jgi:serine/threonine-protein kinase
MAIDAAIMHDKDRSHADATDMLLFARHIALRDPSRFREVIDLLKRAHAMSPRDPRIAANLAAVLVRTAFFMPNAAAEIGARARQLAYDAVTAAPDLADAHLAVGHVELNGGNPILAATHFRYAIRCAPHLAEAHEQLGRMLLETGYLDDALARLEEAIALSPELSSARWEITRALALDGRWAEHDRLVADLLIYSTDRPLGRARYAWWRGDWDTLASLRAQIRTDPTVWPGLIDHLFGAFLDEDGWNRNKAQIVMATRTEVPNRRRRVFTAQLAAEAAGFAGDVETAIELIAYAMEFGLFDAHWMERCVLLDRVRTSPDFGVLHAQIRQRADAIHDALYGDHMALSETAVVP